MKILILDDQPERHEGFIKIFSRGGPNSHKLTHAWTYDQCIEALKNNHFDMICLDHDLGDMTLVPDDVIITSPNFSLTYRPSTAPGGMYSSSEKYLDGRDVCRWIVENLKEPNYFLIHSWNESAAREMEKTLLDAGHSVRRKPYTRQT